jgi:hypothetical protein
MVRTSAADVSLRIEQIRVDAVKSFVSAWPIRLGFDPAKRRVRVCREPSVMSSRLYMVEVIENLGNGTTN